MSSTEHYRQMGKDIMLNLWNNSVNPVTLTDVAIQAGVDEDDPRWRVVISNLEAEEASRSWWTNLMYTLGFYMDSGWKVPVCNDIRKVFPEVPDLLKSNDPKDAP